MDSDRIIRVPLPVHTLRRLDELLATGVGGYGSRAEFIREAIEQLLDVTREGAPTEGKDLAELRHGVVAPSEGKVMPSQGRYSAASPAGERWEQSWPPRGDTQVDFLGSQADPSFSRFLAEVTDPSDIRLFAPPLPTIIEGLPGGFERDLGPLLGLHNRDWVSLWALQRLAEMTQTGMVPWSAFLEQVTSDAWVLGATVEQFEGSKRRRFTTGLPSNPSKAHAAVEGFRSFGIGTIHRPRTDPKKRRVAGAFFTWQVAGLEGPSPTELAIAPSRIGYELLQRLEGISLRLPHPPEAAEAFLGYLEEHAPRDYMAFSVLLHETQNRPDRKRLIAAFAEAFSEQKWTESVASTNVAGFVARAREWGLVEEALDRSRYALTEFGRSWLTSR